jgi:thiosulfate dehydrogenase [quinone] large subunit
MRVRTRLEGFSLVLLRTIIGWHFLYEGCYKLMVPGWSRAGEPLRAWSAAGYLRSSTGPFADTFRALAESAAVGWIDVLVPVGLVLVGLSLMLGWFTQLGASGALAFLTMFYAASIPTSGAPTPGAEGTYLLVNKTLVEWAAVLVVLMARTGEIAGLDLARRRRRLRRLSAATAPLSAPGPSASAAGRPADRPTPPAPA